MNAPLTDPKRLEDIALRLGEIHVHLAIGAPFATADKWPAALEDAMELVRRLAPAPRMVTRSCPECGGKLQRTFALVADVDRPVIACTECEFLEVTK